jgi:hypothetical protein
VPYAIHIIFADVIGLLYMCSNFITGNDRHEDGHIVTLEPKEIAIRYLKGQFIFDLLSALPLQFVMIDDDCEFSTHTAWYILKLLRLASMKKNWNNFYKQIGMSYCTSVTIAVITQMILFFHWMAFIYHQIPKFGIIGPNTSSPWLQHFHKLKTDSIVTRYTTCLFYACGLIIGAGYQKPRNDYLIEELISDSLLSIIGLIFLLYSFTTLIRVAIYNRYDTFLYHGWLKELEGYMVFKQLPNFLQRKIRLYINYKYCEHYYNERSIMDTINEQIKQDINMHCCMKLVLNVQLFKDLPVAFMNAIVFSLKKLIYMPGEVSQRILFYLIHK